MNADRISNFQREMDRYAAAGFRYGGTQYYIDAVAKRDSDPAAADEMKRRVEAHHTVHSAMPVYDPFVHASPAQWQRYFSATLAAEDSDE